MPLSSREADGMARGWGWLQQGLVRLEGQGC